MVCVLDTAFLYNAHTFPSFSFIHENDDLLFFIFMFLIFVLLIVIPLVVITI